MTKAEAEAADAARSASSSRDVATSAPAVSRMTSDAAGRNMSVREMIVTPGSFKCPITQDVMEDPVVAADGHSYERSAIQRHIDHHHEQIRRGLLWTGWARSPMTNVELAHYHFIPNRSLKSAIAEWRQQFRDFRADNPDLEEVAPATQPVTPAVPRASPTPAEAWRFRAAGAAQQRALQQEARTREELRGLERLISALGLEAGHHRVRDRVRQRTEGTESRGPIGALVLLPRGLVRLPPTVPPFGLHHEVYNARFPPLGGGAAAPSPPR